MPDDLSLGPIASTNDRGAWFASELGFAWDDFGGLLPNFWSAALDPGRQRVAWWSWRKAQEYCGFLEFVSRLGDGPCDAIDLSEAAAVTRSGRTVAAETLALLEPEQILASGLIDLAAPLTREDRIALRAHWSPIRAEDAPPRVLTGGGGVSSAPLSFFDDALVDAATDHWRPAALAIAEVLGACWETRLWQTGDVLLSARVHALAAAGRIELRGGDPRRGLAGIEVGSLGSAVAP